MPEKIGLDAGFDLPFQEQVDFFRNKLTLGTRAWDDIMHEAHDRAFVVAGAMKADLLADLRRAVDRAIVQGTSLKAFREDFKQIVFNRGWTGWTGEGSAAGEAWRTKVIWETNLRASYAAGRWAQLNDPGLKKLMPYWRYVHADSVLHPRPLHLAWGQSRLTLPADHPFWKTHFPPNGWGCRCRVTAVAAPKAGDATEPPEGWDDIDEKTGAPAGIDKGWGYAPGASNTDDLKELARQKAKTLPAPLGKALEKDVAGALAKPATEFVEQKTAKAAAEWAVKNNLADYADYTGVKPEVANAFNRSLFDHLQEFPELRKQQQFVGTIQAQMKRWTDLERARWVRGELERDPNQPLDRLKKWVNRKVPVPEVNASTIAHSSGMRDVKGIAVNVDYGSRADALKERIAATVATKFHPMGCDTFRSVADHELGHDLDRLLGLADDQEVIASYIEAVTGGIDDRVSRYAERNIYEYIAECWAESLNNPAPRADARAIAEIVRARYRSKFGAT